MSVALGLAIASVGLVSLAASGLAIASAGLVSLALSFVASTAGAAVTAGFIGGVAVSVAQEARPADKARLATIKRAFKFIVVIFLSSNGSN